MSAYNFIALKPQPLDVCPLPIANHLGFSGGSVNHLLFLDKIIFPFLM
jgi:hypothetical protein